MLVAMTIAKRGDERKDADLVIEGTEKPVFRPSKDLLVVGALVAASAASFGLGSAFSHVEPQKPALNGENTASVLDAPAVTSGTKAAPSSVKSTASSAPKKTVGHTSGTYVASKNGSKYYLPTCASANRIKEENKIWFISKEEAEAAGYTPSSTCKGL
jgi:hypothetical protein